MSFPRHRSHSLARAFAASLLVHLVLLWPAVLLLPEPAVRAPLSVSLGDTGRVVRHGGGAARHQTEGGVRPPRAATVADHRGPAVPAAASEGISEAEGLRGYRLMLARGAAAFRRYPQEAVVAGWQGMAEVRIEISASGVIQQQLWTSSGHETLDQSALAMAHHAVAATPLPEGLRGRALSLTLPFIFDLEGPAE